MNISSMVNQSYLARGFTQKNRKSAKEEDNKQSFETKLYELRKDNKVNNLIKAPDKVTKEDKVQRDDWLSFACTSQLFSAWDSNISAEDAIEKLDANLSKIGEFSFNSNLDPKEILEHISAQHAVYKQHIAATGDVGHMQALDKLVERHTLKFAEKFSEVVGGFYEENGIVGDRERVYTSVVDSVKSLTRIYDDSIANPKFKFDMLMSDSGQGQKSLSNELRKVVRASGMHSEGRKMDHYNSADLSRAVELAKFSINELHIGNAEIKNEEELGIQLGKAALQALHFLGDPMKIEPHKEAFLTSVYKKLDRHLDKVDILLEKEKLYYREKYPDKLDSPYDPLDRSAVFAVVNKMTREYEKTESLESAMAVGTLFGFKQYLSKADVKSDLERYRDSAFWQKEVKQTLAINNEANRQYRWIRNLLNGQTNSWLNEIA